MKSTSLSPATPGLLAGNGLGAGLLKRAVLRQLAGLRHGQLTVCADGERRTYGQPGSEPHGEIHIHDPAAWAMVAGNGSIGAGEAYIHGYWTTPDLTAVIRIFVANLDVLDGMERGLALLGRPLLQGLH